LLNAIDPVNIGAIIVASDTLPVQENRMPAALPSEHENAATDKHANTRIGVAPREGDGIPQSFPATSTRPGCRCRLPGSDGFEQPVFPVLYRNEDARRMAGSAVALWASVIMLALIGLASSAAQNPAKPSPTRELAGHTELVYQLAWSPDGRMLASAGFDGKILLWDVESGKVLRTFDPPESSTRTVLGLHVAFSPNGQLLAGSYSINHVRLWDVPISSPIRSLEGAAEPLFALTVSPDGNRLAAAGQDRTIRIWNIADGKVITTCAGHTATVTGLAFSGNGQLLASISEDQTLRVWNTADGKPLAVLGAHTSRPNAVAFHVNNQAIYTADAEGVLKLWTWPVPPSRMVPAAEGVILATAALDGSRVVVIGNDRVPRVWNAGSAQMEFTLPALPQTPRAIAWSPKGTHLAIALADRNCRIFDLSSRKEIAVHDKLPADIAAIAISPDGGQLLLGLADGSVHQHQLADGKPLRSWPAHPGGVLAVQYLPNTQIVTVGADKTLQLWSADGKSQRKIEIGDTPMSLAVSRDGNRVAVGLAKAVRWWNLADAKEMPSLTQHAAAIATQFSGDGTRLAVGHADGRCVVWDLNSARPLQFFSLDGAVRQLAWMGNNPTVLASTEKTALAVLGLANVRLVPAHAQAIHAFALTPNLSHALTASADGTVRFVNLANGALERQHATPHGAVTAITIARNTAYFATAGTDKSLRFWNFADGKELKTLPMPAVVRALAISPNNAVLLAALENGQVQALDVTWQPGQPLPAGFASVLQQYQQPTSTAPAIAFHPTDNAVWFSVSGDRLPRIWRIASVQPVRLLQGHVQMVDAVAFSPDGQQLATVSHDGTLRFWETASGKLLRTVNLAVQPQPQPLYAVVWTPDGKQVLATGLNRKIWLVDAASGNIVREFRGYDEKEFPRGHRDGVFTLAVLPGASQFLSAGADGQIKLWDMSNGQVVHDFTDPEVPTKGSSWPRAHADFVSQIRLSPDGKYLLSVGSGGWVKIWKLETRQPVYRQQIGQTCYAGVWSPDAKQLAISTHDGRVLLLSTPPLP
jgi:WD40 repeat protein